MDKEILIYSSYNCGYCDRAKKLLDEKKISYREINIQDDPIRPDLSNEFRTSNGRKMFGLKFNDEIEGVVCIAFTNEIPSTIKELELMSIEEGNTGNPDPVNNFI